MTIHYNSLPKYVLKRFFVESKRVKDAYNIKCNCKFTLNGVIVKNKLLPKLNINHFTVIHYNRYVRFDYEDGKFDIFVLVKDVDEIEKNYFNTLDGKPVDQKWIDIANSIKVRKQLSTTKQTLVHRFLHSIMTVDVNNNDYDIDLSWDYPMKKIQSETIYPNVRVEILEDSKVKLEEELDDIPSIQHRIKNPVVKQALIDDKIRVYGGCLINKTLDNDVDILMNCEFDEYCNIIRETIKAEDDPEVSHVQKLVHVEGSDEYQFSLRKRPVKDGFIYGIPYFTSLSANWNTVFANDKMKNQLKTKTMEYKYYDASSKKSIIRLHKYAQKGYRITNPEFKLYANCKQFMSKLDRVEHLVYGSFHYKTCVLLRMNIDKPNDFEFIPKSEYEIVDVKIRLKQFGDNVDEITEYFEEPNSNFYDLNYLLEWAIVTL